MMKYPETQHVCVYNNNNNICIFSPLLKVVKINPGTVFIIITVATVCVCESERISHMRYDSDDVSYVCT